MSDGMIILIVIAVFVVLSLIATIANIKAKPPKPIEKGNLNRPSHYMYKTETTLDDKIAHLFIPEPLRVDQPPMVVDVAMDLDEQQEREELSGDAGVKEHLKGARLARCLEHAGVGEIHEDGAEAHGHKQCGLVLLLDAEVHEDAADEHHDDAAGLGDHPHDTVDQSFHGRPLADGEERVAGIDHLANRDVNGGDGARVLRDDGVLHLHGLENEDAVILRDDVANVVLELEDLTGHGGRLGIRASGRGGHRGGRGSRCRSRRS